MGFAPPPHAGSALLASAHTRMPLATGAFPECLLWMHHTVPPSPTQHALEALFVHMEDALCWIWQRRVRVQSTLTG